MLIGIELNIITVKVDNYLYEIQIKEFVEFNGAFRCITKKFIKETTITKFFDWDIRKNSGVTTYNYCDTSNYLNEKINFCSRVDMDDVNEFNYIISSS